MTAHARPILPAVFALLAALAPGSLFAATSEWTSSGPDGGIVETLAVYPTNPSTVYLATIRRLYKSVDAGASWGPTALPGAPNLVLPTWDPSVVYATSTRSLDIGFYRSSDGGETWVERTGPPGLVISLTVDRWHPLSLYAATDRGLFRTTNGGDAWEPRSTPVPGVAVVAGIAIDPADPVVIYAALDAPVSGVYRSIDRGATWTRTNLQAPARTLLFGPPVDGGPWDYGQHAALYALTAFGLHVTMDAGQSWQRLAPGLQEVSHLATDPVDFNRLYAISGGVVFHSSDGGATWTAVSNGNLGGRLTAIVAFRSVVLVGSDRGLSRSDDGGRLWSAAHHGIREVFVHSLAIDPTDPAVVFAAGPRGIYESRDGGENWNEPVPLSPDAEVVAIDPSDRSTLYAAGRGGVHKSTDGGGTWVNRSSNLANHIYDLVIDPNNPRRIFSGSLSLYRTVNGADSWDRVLTPDEDYSSYYYYPPRVSAIAIAPSDSATVYAGGEDGGFIYRSDDGGDNWSDLTSVDFGVKALAVDSCDPRILHVGAWSTVFRTTDGGDTWTPSPLPSSPDHPYGVSVFALARDPRHSSSVFAGTSGGLFWTNDRGASWTRFEPALTEAVRSLGLDPSGRFLYAGTERGVFSLERTFEACRNGPDRLCLMGAKFQVGVTARNPRTGALITGRAIEEGDQFGYFSFPDVTGDPVLPEVFVKMVDATGAPPPYGGHAWVFHSALTDLDYTLTVQETETGRARVYSAEDFASLTCGKADTSAFVRACEAEAPAAARIPGTRLEAGSGAELSLLGGRFRATIRARDSRTGRIADGAAIPQADGFGYFSLPDFTGDPSFPEVFVKMTDATGLPGDYFWVFHTGLTDLEYTLMVTDRVTGAVRTYLRGAPDGTELCGEADTTAFRNR